MPQPASHFVIRPRGLAKPRKGAQRAKEPGLGVLRQAGVFAAPSTLFAAALLATALFAAALFATGCRDSRLGTPEARSFLEQGRRALQREDPRIALALADSAARRAPRWAEPSVLRGRAYEAQYRLHKAQAAYKDALEANSSHRGARFRLGHVALKDERPRDALRWYRKALRQRGRELRGRELRVVLLQAGRACAELGRPDSARQYYRRVLALDPTNARAHGDLAQLHMNEGRYQAALRHALRALAQAPGDLKHRYRLGALLLRLGRAKRAAEALEAVVSVQPRHRKAQYNLGQALMRLGRSEEARRHLDAAERLRALERSAERARRAVRAEPEVADRWVDLAVAVARNGNRTDAVEAYRTALELDSTNSVARRGLRSLRATARPVYPP